MKQKTKRTPLQKHDIRVTALIASIGAIMMLGTLFFGIEYSRREAQKTMDRNISDLKKQINDYNEFLAADEVKSLIRLTEQAEDLSEVSDYEGEKLTQKEINRRKLAAARKADAEKYGEEYHEDEDDDT